MFPKHKWFRMCSVTQIAVLPRKMSPWACCSANHWSPDVIRITPGSHRKRRVKIHENTWKHVIEVGYWKLGTAPVKKILLEKLKSFMIVTTLGHPPFQKKTHEILKSLPWKLWFALPWVYQRERTQFGHPELKTNFASGTKSSPETYQEGSDFSKSMLHERTSRNQIELLVPHPFKLLYLLFPPQASSPVSVTLTWDLPRTSPETWKRNPARNLAEIS